MASAGSITQLWALLSVLLVTEGKEFVVTCTRSEECVLPCHFQSDGKGARVMWYKKKAVVSCTRYGDTQFVVGHNSPSSLFQGRTDLYADQVLQGNATLLLRNVTPHDQGKYFCITMTAPRTDESGIISLIIKSPVQNIDIQLTGDTISCSSRGIYPAPKLLWSTVPPSDVQAFQNSTKTSRTPEGFYDISGSQRIVVANSTNITYICTITSDTNARTAILKNKGSIQMYPDSGVLIPCSLPDSALHDFNLTWSFRRRRTTSSDLDDVDEEPILAVKVSGQSLSPPAVQEGWKPYVSLGFLTFGHLQLHSLTPEHQGTYRCEVRTADQTHVTLTNVTNTTNNRGGRDDSFKYVLIIAVMAHFLMLAYATLAVVGFKLKRKESSRTPKETGSQSEETVSQSETAVGAVDVQQ